MIGKANEIKTKRVFDIYDTEGKYHGIDDMVNVALEALPPTAEVVSIQYQAIATDAGDDHYALIIYKEAFHG